MRIVKIKAVKAEEKVFDFLEKKGFIKTFKPTKKAVNTKKRNGDVDIIYTSKKVFSSHRLMCIGKKNKKIQFSYHLDNEDLFFLNPYNTDYQKLYLVIALDKKDIFCKKLKTDSLKSKDFVAVEIKFNDPKLSFFTILKNTVHCEIVKNEEKQHPVFFVTESAGLKNNKIQHKTINFVIDGE